ncbi:MAG: A/G-specific adenine glycosylase [Planctomycetes bacterium]|nr:A/G-specific adenine glycosylase [Planctomycetota bacterium]
MATRRRTAATSGPRADQGEPAFAARLLGWFQTSARDLPWRRTRDPWAIWVSEVMLQQTRVAAVREPFAAFVARFPTPAAFAKASDDELFAAWRGLGYYRRARLLREGAKAVVREHGGQVPHTADQLAELPGIGTYTRGAIASIAFGCAEPAIDGNVERVVARHRGIREPVDTAAVRRRIHAQVVAWLPTAAPGDFNQALMELGATVCTPQAPACERCPVAADCLGRAAGIASELPRRKPRRASVEVTARAVLVFDRGRALGARVPAGEPNAGQIELPSGGALCSLDPTDLPATLHERYGAHLDCGPVLASIRHAITHHRITVHGHAGTANNVGRLNWLPLDATTPWTTIARKLFAAVLGSDSLRQSATGAS